MKRFALILIAWIALTGCEGFDTTQLQDVARILAGGELDEATVDAGLREALRVGTGRAVDRTSASGGFLDDPLLRVALPDKLEDVAEALRTIGLRGEVENFETAMNRAAERASAEATDVFVDAITGMTLQDVFNILDGDDTAATQYFRGRTETTLRSRFEPVVQGKMRELDVYREYESLLARYDQIPFVEKPNLDLADHITSETLDGLFQALGDEEKKIREDPVARTTELLQRVFGSRR